MRKSLILTLITTAITTVGYGQSSIGIDIYNRYVWRGTDFGNATAIQPNLEFKNRNLTIGAWSSWAVNGKNSSAPMATYVINPQQETSFFVFGDAF